MSKLILFFQENAVFDIVSWRSAYVTFSNENLIQYTIFKVKVLRNMEDKGSIGWFLHKTQRDKLLKDVVVDIPSGEKPYVVMLKGVLGWLVFDQFYQQHCYVKFNAAHLNLIKKN